ncbi:MAG: metallophosphoesterase [Candidatus Nanosalina sp.]
MKIHGFETVDSLPCLHHPEMNLLVLSDVHLGLEGSVTSEGGYVPKFQLEDILKDIETAREETDASRILVNGDLKNEFRKNYYSEKKEVDRFIKELQKDFDEVIIIKGNHDNFLDEIVEKNGLKLKKRHLEQEILFVHGHQDVESLEDYQTVVIGHEHPALSLKDEIGVVEKVDCLLHGETTEGTGIIVLPAFSNIANGTRINETPKSELLSPVLRNHTSLSSLKAVAISRDAGVFKFPEIGKI